MPASKITIKEVAQKAGVSIASVSRFLNTPAIVKEPNRKRIESAIKELNYQPFMYARRLAGGKLGVYSLIMPGYEGIFYSFFAIEIIRGIANSLDAKGIDLHLHVFRGRDTFKSSLVDGVIFADILGNDAQFDRLTKNGIPTVLLNKKIDNAAVSYVAVDNFKGAFDAVEFMIHHGHKKIAHLAGDLRIQCAQERLEGYAAALAKNNIDRNMKYTQMVNFSRKEAREKLQELFAGSDRPTAVFCCSDEVAMEVLSFAEEKNISVPGQLSVIGFDDNPNFHYGEFMLTTVRQPIAAMASAAVDVLSELTSVENAAAKKVILDTELVVRDTVGYAASA